MLAKSYKVIELFSASQIKINLYSYEIKIKIHFYEII